MSTTLWPRTLALAGLFQAARLAQDLARRGQTDNAALAASLQSILRLDAPSAEDVFGGIKGVALGLALVRDHINTPADAGGVEMLRYIVALIQLERRLSARPEMLQHMGKEIQQIESRMQFFAAPGEDTTDRTHPRRVEKLAELYSQTISTLQPRIMVSGEHGHLSNPATAAGVRAALLAGIRAAVLWRQLGGRRWQLLFMRRRFANQATMLLQKLDQAETE